MNASPSNDKQTGDDVRRGVLAIALEHGPSIEVAAKDAGFSITYVDNILLAVDEMERSRPAAVLVDARTFHLGDGLSAVRAAAAQAGVPIIALAHAIELSSLGFADALGGGADDLCPRRRDPLARRLRAIAQAREIDPAPPSGRVIVIDGDRMGRTLTGCALRRAGYEVVFAENAAEGLAASLEGQTKFVTWRLGSLDEMGTGSPAPAVGRSLGSLAPWIVGTRPNQLAQAQRRLDGIDAAVAYDAFGPPVDVLFVANELLNRQAAEARATVRVLYGAVIHARPAGGEHDELGYLYNVSAGGLYVRTLAPFDQGADIWLELSPPRTPRRVRLEATVVWVRRFGGNERATVPPGFGARITGGLSGDLDRYARGCEAFAGETRASRSLAPVKSAADSPDDPKGGELA